jgi:small conductance mechanosensitive channel
MSSNLDDIIGRIMLRRDSALYAIAICVIAAAAAVRPQASTAQIPAKLLPKGPAVENAAQLPRGVRRVGNVELAPVEFELKQLFDITGPVILNRTQPGNETPVEVRANQVEENLRHVLVEEPERESSPFGAYDTFYDPSSFRVSIVTVSDHPVLVAGDAKHPNDVTLLTVTERDARYYGVPARDLATRWQRTLQSVLVSALEARQPALFNRHIELVPKILAVLLPLSAVLWFAGRRLHRWRAGLEAKAADDESVRSQSEQTRQLASLFQWIVAATQVMIWLAVLGWILSVIPATQAAMKYLWEELQTLAVIWLLAGLLAHVGALAARRVAQAWANVQFLPREVVSRRSRRIPTISGVVQGTLTFLIYFVAIGVSLNVLRVSSGSLLTIAALAALAVSLAAQSLIKDLTNGIVILAEDQFAIGDYVWIGNVRGVVEYLSLRATKVREDDGRLTTIPNSQVSIVQNAAHDWGRVDAVVNVAYDSDIARALAVIAAVGDQLFRDPSWRDAILEAPRVLGVDAFSHAGVAIRVWIMTLPRLRMHVHREFNRRVHDALQEHGIGIGMPQQTVHAGPPAAAGSPAPAAADVPPPSTIRAAGPRR